MVSSHSLPYILSKRRENRSGGCTACRSDEREDLSAVVGYMGD
jgi:hypothetical protein